MLPKIHAKGASFKALAFYVLHDKQAETRDRVAWTHTVNLATDDPDLAWRIMAATAMDRERLKEQAGVKKTGRKSADVVLHLTMSWRSDEIRAEDREEMLGMALAAIKALGAEDRQALIVSHNDEEHHHVHVMINRVSAENGVMLPSSHEKARLSDLARTYEVGRGMVLCPQRVENHRRRQRGEYIRGKKDIPRHEYEARQQEERAGKEQTEREMQALSEKHRQELEALAAAKRQRLAGRREAIRQDYRKKWQELYRRQQAERARDTAERSTLLGRLRVMLRAVRDTRKAGLPFSLTAFKSFRPEARLEERQRAERTKLGKEYRALVKSETRAIDQAFQETSRMLEREHATKTLSLEERLIRRTKEIERQSGPDLKRDGPKLEH